MTMNAFWTGMTRVQRFGFAAGVLLIVGVTAALGYWSLRDPWVVVARELPADRLVSLTREMAREKLDHRVAEDGTSLEVRQSAVGRARAAAATGGVGLPPNVGLEIFKETDFSATDFSQRINYQRALQGELSRTLQTITGVLQARVHVVLPEGGVLKRGTNKASAAVTLALAPGKTLSRTQVRGVQRLVASSVPDIKTDDVVVLDDAGTSLVRDAAAGDTDLSGVQLDMKRQVDGYLETKLSRLLEELAPGVQVSLSVDTVLDYKQMKVTVEEPIASPGSKAAERNTGVVSREREVQRAKPKKGGSGDEATFVETTDVDVEYKVGHRIEQSLQAPGTIRRISVAVAVQGAPADLSSDSVERLVAHAVGIDRQRGDSVMVLLLGRGTAVPARHVVEAPPSPAPVTHSLGIPSAQAAPVSAGSAQRPSVDATGMSVTLAAGVALLGALVWRRRSVAVRTAGQPRLDEVAQHVRTWLNEDATHGQR